MNQRDQLTSIDLATVTGGIDWSASHAKGAEWAARGGAAGAAIGGSLGAMGRDKYAETVGGAALGGVFGVAGGYLAGLSKGVYDTWNK